MRVDKVEEEVVEEGVKEDVKDVEEGELVFDEVTEDIRGEEIEKTKEQESLEEQNIVEVQERNVDDDDDEMEEEEKEEEKAEEDMVEKDVLEKNDMDMDTSGRGDEQSESALEVSGKLSVERNDNQVKVDVAKEEVFVREEVVEKMFTRSSANLSTSKHEKDMVSTSTAELEAMRKKRTFRKFAYRGVDLDQLLDLSVTQVIIFSFIKCLSQEFSLTRVLAHPVLFSLQVSSYLSRFNV